MLCFLYCHLHLSSNRLRENWPNWLYLRRSFHLIWLSILYIYRLKKSEEKSCQNFIFFGYFLALKHLQKKGFEYRLLRNSQSHVYQVIFWSTNVKCETSLRLGNCLLSVPMWGGGGGVSLITRGKKPPGAIAGISFQKWYIGLKTQSKLNAPL